MPMRPSSSQQSHELLKLRGEHYTKKTGWKPAAEGLTRVVFPGIPQIPESRVERDRLR